MSNQAFYNETLEILRIKNIVDKLVLADQAVSIPIRDVGSKRISFNIQPNLYFIDFCSLVRLNFAENTNLTAEEIAGDIDDVLGAIAGHTVRIRKLHFLGHDAYKIVGLDSKRFSSTDSLFSFLTLKFGKVVEETAVALD